LTNKNTEQQNKNPFESLERLKVLSGEMKEMRGSTGQFIRGVSATKRSTFARQNAANVKKEEAAPAPVKVEEKVSTPLKAAEKVQETPAAPAAQQTKEAPVFRTVEINQNSCPIKKANECRKYFGVKIGPDRFRCKNYLGEYKNGKSGCKNFIDKTIQRPVFDPANRPNNQDRFNRPDNRNYAARPIQPRPFGAQNKDVPNLRGIKPTELPKEFLNSGDRNRGSDNRDKRREYSSDEKRTLNVRQQMRFGLLRDNERDEERGVTRKLNRSKKSKETETVVKAEVTHAVMTSENITVKDLSEKISKPVSGIISKLMGLGLMLTMNSNVDFDTAAIVATEFGVTLEKKVKETAEDKVLRVHAADDEKDLKERPPVITIMGHVDHGKTSLLDAIRSARVVAGEHGGITQHIGAYQVEKNGKMITFIDTPGHAAFSAMRKRGANVTDIAILVVAADDGVMPQTIEAIKHIKAAKVPMLVAVNKIDKPTAKPERVKQQLAEHGVLSEEWGGETVFVEVSALQKIGLDKLLEMIILVSELGNLRANPNREATGTVLEANLDKNRGATATLLVQNGTLKVGQSIVCGTSYGKIRALADYNGTLIRAAKPGTPVSVIGLNEPPTAGDYFYVTDEKTIKKLIEERKVKIRESKIQTANTSVDAMLGRIDASKLKYVNIIIKADTMGSAEALAGSLTAIHNDEVKVNIINASAGQVSESDITYAESTGASLVAFNTKYPAKVKSLAESKKIKIMSANVLYRVVEEVEVMVKALETPKFKEEFLGRAEVRVVFKLSSFGTIAGSHVLEGKIERGAHARVIRKKETIATGKIQSLKVVKEDVKEVREKFDCGIKVDTYNAYEEGDIIECYQMIRIN